MRKSFYLLAVVVAAFTQNAISQDDSELRMRRALEGRFLSVKMDLPAIDAGVYMTLDDTVVTFNEAAYKRLVKEYGVAIGKGARSRITGVKISTRGIELDLDGGGSPGREWVVNGINLTEPSAAAKSDREIQLERDLANVSNSGTAAHLRSELDDERQRRQAQDDRNRQAFERAKRLRSEYIEENRKNWGSKVIISIRSRKPTVTMRDILQSLSKYIELLPREPAG